MPDPRNPSPKALRSPDTVEVLVDDDQVNKDNLYVELAPGGTPKLTLGYLHDLVAGIAQPGTTTRVVAIEPLVASGTWVDQGVGNWKNTTHTGDSLWFILPAENAPPGATLTGVTAYVHPAGAHGGLPGSMPSITLVSQTVSQDGAVYTTIHATPDASGNVTAYELAHTIAMTGQTTVVDRSTTRYAVVFQGESSTNAVNNLQLTGLTTTWTY